MSDLDKRSQTNLADFVLKMGKRYENNRLLRALVPIVSIPLANGVILPVGIAADQVVTKVVELLYLKRAETLFDEIAKHHIPLTNGEVLSEEVLHPSIMSLRFALSTGRPEKIVQFASLLATYLKGESFQNIDDFEDALKIVDDLSMRELQMLLILHSFEKEHPPEGEQNALQAARSFWSEFLEAVESEIGFRIEEIPAALERLNRTGLYQTFIGSYIGYDGNVGHLTPFFETFLAALGHSDRLDD